MEGRIRGCLIDTEFQFRKMIKFWRQIVGQYDYTYHRNAHLNMVKMINFMFCLFYHN